MLYHSIPPGYQGRISHGGRRYPITEWHGGFLSAVPIPSGRKHKQIRTGYGIHPQPSGRIMGDLLSSAISVMSRPRDGCILAADQSER